MTELDIVCRATPDGDGWICDVTVDVDGGTRPRHQVRVAGRRSRPPRPRRPRPASPRRPVVPLPPRARADARRSCAAFDLMEIARYFPEYEATIRRRPADAPAAYASRPMCEHFVARAAEPFRLDELWPFTERLERFGIAGFGWGAAWPMPSGSSARYRDIRAFRDDPGRDDVGRVETTAALVHLRRPSKLSTLGSPTRSRSTTRPAASRSATTATSARSARGGRATATRAGSTAGPTPRSARAGSRTAGTDGRAGDAPRATLHDDVRRPGEPRDARPPTATSRHYAGNTENPVFTFRLGRIGIASTGIYSLDRSLFQLRRPGARPSGGSCRVGGAVTLDRNGAPSPGVVAQYRRRRRTGRGRGSGTMTELAIADRPTPTTTPDGRPTTAPADSATSSGSRCTGSA